jgi:hypothetical protein
MKKCLLVYLSLVVWIGCAKKSEKPQIAGWVQNTSDIQLPSFKYPEGWNMVADGGSRYTVYSSPEVVDRFYDYTVQGKDGARFVVWYERMDTLKTLDECVHMLKGDLTASGFDISEVVEKPVQGIPGTLVHYSGFVDAKNKLEAMQVLAVKDSFLCTIKYEAFNKFFPACASVLDTVLVSFRFPISKESMKPEDLARPSPEFKIFEDSHFKISYPANFETSFPTVKMPVEFSLKLQGYRQDSYIQIDIMQAKDLTLEKVVEQNSKFFTVTSQGETAIDGQKAVYLNYSPVKGINSRVYFLVKNNKTYRGIFNYYADMKGEFLPAFEKTIGSLSVK